MKLSIVEVFAQETSTQANSFTVFLFLKCMYENARKNQKQKTILSESCVEFINQNATFLKVCNLSERCIVCNLLIYIYIYIYWVGPPRGAHGEETHPSLVGLQFSSLIHEGFLQYKLFKKPSPIRCGTRGFVF